MKRLALPAALAALLVAVLALGSGVVNPRGAPALDDPDAAATALAGAFLDTLVAQDPAAFLALSSPAFQIARSDGSGATREAYAASLPVIEAYEISGLAAVQAGDVLTARYLLAATGITPEGRAYAPGPAPRLSVFTWDGSAWKLAAHANFNPLTGGAGSAEGTEYALAFTASGDPGAQRLRTVGEGGRTRYGLVLLAGDADLGGTPVAAEILSLLDYVDGSGDHHGFLTLRFPSGDELALRYRGTTTAGGTGAEVEGTLDVVGGTGALVGVTGGGTLAGTRTGPPGSPVTYSGSVRLAGLP